MIYNSVVPYGYSEARSAVEGLLARRDYVTECEQLLHALTGKHAVLTESGLTALLQSLKINHIVAGDELLVPAYLCQWVGGGLIRNGYRLVFVDVNDDYNMSATDLAQKITRNSKAAIAVHSYGIPCDLQQIKQILNGSSILLIEDSAQSFGYKPNGRMLGTLGDAGIYSFGWFKPISAMGGGALILDNIDLCNHARSIINRKYSSKQQLVKTVKALFYLNKWLYHRVVLEAYGYTKKTVGASGPGMTSTPLQQEFKSMQNVQAAIALPQLGRAEKFNRSRLEHTSLLLEGLHLEGIKSPKEGEAHPMLRLPLFFEDYSADQVKTLGRKLFEAGIETAPMLYPYLPDALKLTAPLCAKAKELSERTLHLPVHPSLTKRDIEKIKTTFNRLLRLT